MTNQGKTISFRAREDDIGIIEGYKKQFESIRKVTDADVLRYGLSLISGKKNIKKIPSDVIQKIEDNKEEDQLMTDIFPLTVEQKEKGYRYIGGELCDKDGFPVEQSGDMVMRNGEVFATEPKRSELKEAAKINSSTLVSHTPFGKVNPAMEEALKDSPKVEIASKHLEPGLLATFDGVDESINEDNFID